MFCSKFTSSLKFLENINNMALYVSFSHRRIHNDLVPVQFGLRIFPTGTFLGLIEKQLHIQSIQSVASCVPKLFKILIKINMRVLMIFLLSFSFFMLGGERIRRNPFIWEDCYTFKSPSFIYHIYYFVCIYHYHNHYICITSHGVSMALLGFWFF